MPGRLSSYFPKNIQFFVLSLLLLVFVNYIFRVLLFLLNFDLADNATSSDITYSLFNIGLRFDLYISLIILMIPFIISSIPFLINKNSRPYLIVSQWILIILATINIAVLSSDLGFFKYYNARITKTIFDWTGELGVMLKIMASDTNYLKYTIIFIVVSLVYIFIQYRILKRVLFVNQKRINNFKYSLIIFLGMLILIFFGLRSSFNFSKTPLKFEDAFHSENLFLNQLSLNPVYNFAHTYSDVDIKHFESSDEYIQTALGYLNRKGSPSTNPFEIIVSGSDSLRPNIILVFLESMSNAMVSRYNPERPTTPYLDKLANEGIVFDNFYSAGVHTHNAITSTFYGLPAVMNNRPMNELATASMIFYGMPWILKEKGYFNSFYVTGSKKFDNMNDFLSLNGFDRVIGEKDYPVDSIYNSWGVTDKTMFNTVLSDCDKMYESDNIFFTSVLTISAHEGYAVPEESQSKLINEEHPFNMYEFSDLLFGEFIEQAKNKEWFDETIFVIVGDHGQNFSTVYDLNLNYHRVPLVFYAPNYFDHLVYNDPGLQQDIYPTLFGLFDISYVNNGLGVDLLKQKREYAYFSADTKLGIIDDEYFLIYRSPNNISMFDSESGSVEDLYSVNILKAEEMIAYGFSMIQSAKYLIDHKLTNIEATSRYDIDRYIAHAGGRIDGHMYTNSLEALNAGYQKGFRLFELDILKTSDNHYVAAHDWKMWQQMTGFKGELPPNKSEFKEYQLLHKYTPLDLDDINNWFQSHTDAILVTDKINEPMNFSNEFIYPDRLMMEIFTLEALKEAAELNIKSAIPNLGVVKQLKGDKIKSLVDLGVTEIVMSRRDIENNIPFLIQLKNRSIKVYVFHVNYDEGKDESYVFCHDMDYIYGMYADDFDFSKKVDCN